MQSFQRSVGPQADLKEFEYIAALQQTCPDYTRVSATISSLDVMRFLKSRYSLEITHGQAIDIVKGLGGGILSQDVRSGVADLYKRKQQLEADMAATVKAATIAMKWKNKNNTNATNNNTEDPNDRSQTMSADKKLKSSKLKSSLTKPFEKWKKKEAKLSKEQQNENNTRNEFQQKGGGPDQQQPSQEQSKNVSSSIMEPFEKWKNLGSLSKRKEQTKLSKEQREAGDEADLLEEMINPKLAYLDIVQMVSVLLIPTICKYSKLWHVQNVQEQVQDYQRKNMSKTKLQDEDHRAVLSERRTTEERDRDNSKTKCISPKDDAVGISSSIQLATDGNGNNKDEEDRHGPKDDDNNNNNNIGMTNIWNWFTGDTDHNNNVSNGGERDIFPNRDNLLSGKTTTNDGGFGVDDSGNNNRNKSESIEIGISSSEILNTSKNNDDRISYSHSFQKDASSDIFNLSSQAYESSQVDHTMIANVWDYMKLNIGFFNGGNHGEGNSNNNNDDLSPRPDHLLEFVLDRMITQLKQYQEIYGKTENGSDTYQTTKAPIITPELVKSLFMIHGEYERAHDEILIQQMIDAAKVVKDGDEDEDPRLDMKSFVHALSADLMPYWDVGCEDRLSTCLYDVFGLSDLNDDFERSNFSNTGRYHEKAATTNSASFASSVTPKATVPWHLSHANGGENNADGVEHSTNKIQDSTACSDLKKGGDGGIDEGNTSFAASSVVLSSPKEEDKENDSIVEDDTVVVQKLSGQIIDTVVDTFGSSFVLLLVWTTYLMHGLTYTSLVLSTDALTEDCEGRNPYGCKLAWTVVNWLVLALLLSGFGIFLMVPISYGNHPTRRTPSRLLVSSGITALISFVPFWAVEYYKRNSVDEPYSGAEDIMERPYYDPMMYFTVSLGLLVALNYFILFVIAIGRQKKKFGLNGLLSRLWTTSDEVGSTRLKHAATRKINMILTNARKMHGVVHKKDTFVGQDIEDDELSNRLKDSQADPSFQNFLVHGEEKIACGNFFWAWRRLLTGEIFSDEGIWFPARMWIFQFGQCIVAFLMIVALFKFSKEMRDRANEANEDLPDDSPQWVYDLIPTGDQVEYALIPAATVGSIIMVFIILIYVPSTTATVLKFRCGHFPSLGSDSFNEARTKADAAHMNTANAIYGMAAAGGLFFFLIGLVIFLFIWDFSREFMLLLTAWGIGLTITIMLKVLLTAFFRKQFYRAFYRLHPGRANLSILGLECWFIGLGGGVLLGRITQFLLAAAFWIGRIDEPFLADNVSMAGYRFDYVPVYYTKEILLHEAHRHPFIERLGSMYLMRLRYKRFGSDAGGCWRQLFVLTLMPWMVKHRISHQQRCEEAVRDHQAEIKKRMAEESTFADTITDEVAQVVGTGTHYVTGATEGAVDAGIGAGAAAVNVGLGAGAMAMGARHSVVNI